jgi:hypothetical protein
MKLKLNVIKVITKNSPQYPLNIEYNDKYTEEHINTKFLGLQIDSHLNWKKNIRTVDSKTKQSMLCT